MLWNDSELSEFSKSSHDLSGLSKMSHKNSDTKINVALVREDLMQKMIIIMVTTIPLCEKCPNTELFLVRIFLYSY